MAWPDQTASGPPDGLTMLPWKEGKPLSWDVTAICPLADSYVDASARNAGSAAELAADRKVAMYSVPVRTHIFKPTAVESSGRINSAVCSFLAEFGRKISLFSGDDRDSSHLFLSALLQRYNALLLHDSFSSENHPDDCTVMHII